MKQTQGYSGGIKWRIWNKQDDIHLEPAIRSLHRSQRGRSHCGTTPLEDQWHSSKGPRHWLLSALHSDILLDFQYWVQGVTLIWSFSQFHCIKIPTRVKGYRTSVAQMFPQSQYHASAHWHWKQRWGETSAVFLECQHRLKTLEISSSPPPFHCTLILSTPVSPHSLFFRAFCFYWCFVWLKMGHSQTAGSIPPG